MVDDMIDSGNTLALAARSLRDNGAKKVYALISHGARFSLLRQDELVSLIFVDGCAHDIQWHQHRDWR